MRHDCSISNQNSIHNHGISPASLAGDAKHTGFEPHTSCWCARWQSSHLRDPVLLTLRSSLLMLPKIRTGSHRIDSYPIDAASMVPRSWLLPSLSADILYTRATI